MSLHLKPGTQFVPQGIPFRDPKTNKTFCGYELSVDGAIRAIIEHRQHNPTVYPPSEPQWFSPIDVRQEFLQHVKSKMPYLLVGGGDPVRNPPIKLGAPEKCACGGTVFTTKYCPTCSGLRPNGYKCDKCGKVVDL